MNPFPKRTFAYFLCFVLASLLLNLSCNKDEDALRDALFDTPEEPAIPEEQPDAQERGSLDVDDNQEQENQPIDTLGVAVDSTALEVPEDSTALEDLVERNVVFPPIHDAFLQEGEGFDLDIVRLGKDRRTSYLMFDMSPIASVEGQITSATLQFTVQNDDGHGTIKVLKGTSNKWTETDLSEESAPTAGVVLGSARQEYQIGTEVEIQLNAAELLPQVASMVLFHSDGDDFAFASKENKRKQGARLVVNYEAPKSYEAIAVETVQVISEVSEEENTETEMPADTEEEDEGVDEENQGEEENEEKGATSDETQNEDSDESDNSSEDGTTDENAEEEVEEASEDESDTEGEENAEEETDTGGEETSEDDAEGEKEEETSGDDSETQDEGDTDEETVTEDEEETSEDDSETQDEGDTDEETVTEDEEETSEDDTESEGEESTDEETSSEEEESSEPETDEPDTDNPDEGEPDNDDSPESEPDEPNTDNPDESEPDEDDTSEPEPDEPDTDNPDNEDTSEPEPDEPDDGEPEPDQDEPDDGEPDDDDTSQPEPDEPDTDNPDDGEADDDTSQPEPDEPDDGEPDDDDTSEPEPDAPNDGEPDDDDTSNPEPDEPDTDNPDDGEPDDDTSEPEPNEPDDDDTSEPEPDEPDTDNPDDGEPDDDDTSNPEPDEPEPDNPDEGEPDDDDTSNPEPDEPEPDNPDDGEPDDDTSEPEPDEPDTDNPDDDETSEPDTDNPDEGEPDEPNEPDTPADNPTPPPPPSNTPPITVIAATPSTGTAPLEVSFIGSDSSDDKAIVSYAWDFQDGNTSTTDNAIHTFNEAGTYKVTLKTTDEEGLNTTEQTTITVEAPINEAPVAQARANELSGEAPLKIDFTGSASSDDSGITEYDWSFPGGTSTEQNPAFTFENAGVFEVGLTVTDEQGLQDSTTLSVTVTEPTVVAKSQIQCGEGSLQAAASGRKIWCWSDLDLPEYSGHEGVLFDNRTMAINSECYEKQITKAGDRLKFRVDPVNPYVGSWCPKKFNMRAEVRTAIWDVRNPPGTEEWFGWSYTFGNDYEIDQNNQWKFFQVHNGIDGTPPQIGLEVIHGSQFRGHEGGEIYVVNECHGTEGRRADFSPTGIIPKAGQTIDVVVHAIWENDSKGMLQVWINGKKVYDKQVSTLLPGYNFAGNGKWGIYKWPWEKEEGVKKSQEQGITHLETYMGTLRMITRQPGDPDYGTDSYAEVAPD